VLEQNDEWTVQRQKYMNLGKLSPMSENDIIKLPNNAA
jgi:hypothetical protein